MMYNFPYFPHFYPKSYYNYPQYNTKNVENHTSVKKNIAYNNALNNSTYQNGNVKKDSHNHKINNSDDSIHDKKTKPKMSKDDTIFEIFGIKLHYDDILLICLIFFLYNEGVKDEFLFIALILLLLS